MQSSTYDHPMNKLTPNRFNLVNFFYLSIDSYISIYRFSYDYPKANLTIFIQVTRSTD